jgi:hypothetical protein
VNHSEERQLQEYKEWIDSLQKRLAELESDKAELLSAMGEAFSFKINTELGRMNPTREALALSNVTRLLAQQSAKENNNELQS